MGVSSEDDSLVRNHFRRHATAFTLVELLLVLATVAALTVLLLPALAGTRIESKTTLCAARFKLWAASAILYANDHQDQLPSSSPYAGGAYAWDAGTNIFDALCPYGMDVAVWFCPLRPNEWERANQWAQARLGHPILNAADLRSYSGRSFPFECILNDNYWVPRYFSRGKAANSLFPRNYSSRSGVTWPGWLLVQPTVPGSAIYGWPQKLHDAAVPYVPFVSDSAASGIGGRLNSTVFGATVNCISPNTAHFVDGTLIGVNLAFADGHVASHTPDQMLCVYEGLMGTTYWFY
jgi:prepilin-type processing-associated H-X9-DG protein